MKTMRPLFTLALTAAATMATACGGATMTMRGDGMRPLAAFPSELPPRATNGSRIAIDGTVGGPWAVTLAIVGTDGADLVRLTLAL